MYPASGAAPSLPKVAFGPFTSPFRDMEEDALVEGLLDGRLNGIAVGPEAVFLPSDAELEIQLHDISLSDGEAPAIARTKIVPAEKLPLEFSLSYDRRHIRRGRTYAISGTIRSGNQLLFANEATHLVFSHANQSHVKLRLVAVG